MYAIIVAGGKQYKVQEGDLVKVELIKGEIGTEVKFPVIMISDEDSVKIGEEIKDKFICAEITYQGKGNKINIFTYKAKKNVRKRKGHRQPYTEVKIGSLK